MITVQSMQSHYSVMWKRLTNKHPSGQLHAFTAHAHGLQNFSANQTSIKNYILNLLDVQKILKE